MMFEDKKLTCPYNASHKIQPHRMSLHLVKCQKQYPNANVRICPFNQTHHVPTSGYERHVQSCPDKIVLQENVIVHPYGNPDVERGPLKPEAAHFQARAGEEDWEAEMTAEPYDPQKKCRENPIIRGIQGATKSERRRWREEEKVRHQELNSRQKSEIPGLSPTPNNLRRPRMGEDSQNTTLRRPKLPVKPANVSTADLSVNRSVNAIAAAQSNFAVNEHRTVTAIGRGRQINP